MKHLIFIYQIAVIYIISLCIFSCEDTIVDGKGSDLRLKNTEWKSQPFFTPDFQLCYDYLSFDSKGSGGKYYHFVDSCHDVDTVFVWYGGLLIDSLDYKYLLLADILTVNYPLFDASNPDSIVGEFHVRYTKIDLDTVILSYCY